MSEKLIAPHEPGEGQFADKQVRRQESVETPADPTERRQLVIRSLLETFPVDVDDKLATVKAAHHVDKDRFQSAFRSLMRNTKT